MLNYFGKQKTNIIKTFILVFFIGNGFVFANSKIIPRKILALYKGSDNHTEEANEIYQLAQLPLNNLGLVVEYVDAEGELPNPDQMTDYRGVFTWFITNHMKNAKNYRRWLLKILNEKKLPVLIFDRLGAYQELGKTITNNDIRAVKNIFNSLGLHCSINSWASKEIKITFKDSEYFDFEAKLSSENISESFDVLSIDTKNKVLMKLSNSNFISDVATITPKGAYIQSDIIYKENPNTGLVQWYINPYKIFSEVFSCHEFPIFDLNTIGGKRVAFIHVDGDGFSTISKIDRWHLCAQLLHSRIIKKYPLPYSISVIAAEIDSNYMGNEETIKTAREILRQPNVEAASHGFAHPFDWQTGKLELDSIPDYEFNAKTEIETSVEYIQNSLLPTGKSINLFFWTGKCNPNENHIELVKKAKCYQINGGAGKLDLKNPSISGFYPPYSQVGNQFRINARISNEYEFTNLWKGPFDGYRQVIESIKYTEKDQQIPVDIYFHFYSMEFDESAKGLHDVIKYAYYQDWNFVYASQYITSVHDFLEAKIYNHSKDEYIIHNSGFLSTIKFPNENRNINLQKSINILGYTYQNGNLLVHLNNEKQHQIVFGKSNLEKPFVELFNRKIDIFENQTDTLFVKLNGYGNFTATLKNLPQNKSYEVITFSNLNVDEYSNSNFKSLVINQKKSDKSDYFQSDTAGTMKINLFIENRTLLFITPTSSFQFALAKMKMWLLGVVVVGFITSQMIWMRKRNNQN